MKKTTKVLSLLLVLCMVISMLPAVLAAGELPFSDVSRSDWFYDEVAYVYENGMMSGTGDSSFSPNATTTRGMIVTILHRMEGEPIAAGEEFTDVAEGAYYAEAVAWASAYGIVSGYGNGCFGPDDAITREQMAAILYRFADYQGKDTRPGGNVNDYSDGDKVSAYAVDAMNWAIGEGLISGVGANKLDPTGSATRAQVAAILMRYCEDTEAEEETDKIWTPEGTGGSEIKPDPDPDPDPDPNPDPNPAPDPDSDPEPTPDPTPDEGFKIKEFKADKKVIMVSKAEPVTFYAHTTGSVPENETISVICGEQMVAVLRDNGMDADDIANDKIYSGTAYLNYDKPCELTYYAQVGEYISGGWDIEVTAGYTAEELLPYNQAVETMEAAAAEADNVDEKIEIVAEMAEQYCEAGLVLNYEKNSDGVMMTFSNGIIYVYLPEREGIESGTGEGVPTVLSEQTESVANKTVLAIRPFLAKDGIGASLTEGLEDFPDYGYSINYISNGSVTVQQLKSVMADHEVIVWRGHGGNWTEGYSEEVGIILSLSEARTDTKDQKTYAADLNDQRVLWTSGGRYVINAKFIDHYYDDGDFEGALVYLGACHPMDEDALPDVFLDHGASTVVGVRNTIDSPYNENITETFFTSLATLDESGNKTLTVKTSLKVAQDEHGSTDGEGAFHVIEGNENYVIYGEENSNLSFEEGKKGWSGSGDFRVLQSVGTLLPTHESNLGLIGTGLGINANGSDQLVTSSMSSEIVVSKDQKLVLDYNFVSEEPSEWVVSEYDDTLQFILHVNGKGYLLQEETVNTAEWIYLGENYFYDGDDTTYHTGWKTLNVDLGQIEGIGAKTTVTLEVKIMDKGDTIYDSVVLVDNIRITK